MPTCLSGKETSSSTPTSPRSLPRSTWMPSAFWRCGASMRRHAHTLDISSCVCARQNITGIAPDSLQSLEEVRVKRARASSRPAPPFSPSCAVCRNHPAARELHEQPCHVPVAHGREWQSGGHVFQGTLLYAAGCRTHTPPHRWRVRMVLQVLRVQPSNEKALARRAQVRPPTAYCSVFADIVMRRPMRPWRAWRMRVGTWCGCASWHPPAHKRARTCGG